MNELISKWYCPGRDEIDAAASDVCSVPTQAPWPSSWIHLAQTIRRLQPPVFWEVFAGCAELTRAFENEDIQCAPPIDAADNPE